MARSYLQAQKCLGGIKRSDSHQYYDSGFRTKIPFSSPSIISASSSSFAKQISTSSHSSTHPKTSQSRNYQENNFSSTPFLFSFIYCPQKRQFPSSYNRPISSKQIFDNSNLQNGVSCKDYHEHHGSSLGLHSRHHRCIFPCTPQLGVSNVFCICNRQHNLCLPVSTFRSFSSPMGFFKGNETNKGSSSQNENNDLFIPGRFLHPKPNSIRSKRDNFPCSSTVQKVRTRGKFSEIIPCSISKDRISGCNFSSRHPSTFSSSRKNCYNHFPLSVHNSSVTALSSSPRESFRSSEFCLSPSSSGTSSSPSSYCMDEFSHFSGVQGPSYSFGPLIPKSPPKMAGSKILKYPSSYGGPNTVTSTNDRCIASRLGCSYASSQDFRPVGETGQDTFHELVRTKCNIFSSEGILPTSPEQKCSNHDRQRDSCVMHSSPGVSKVSALDVSNNQAFQLLSTPLNYSSSKTFEWQAERPSRSGFSSDSHLDRMVAGSNNLQMDLLSSRPIPNRSVCHSVQQQTLQIHISLPRSFSFWNQRPLSSLEHLGFHLPFPPNSHSPRSSFSADQLQREGSSDSSLVRRVELVSNPPRQVAGSSTSSFIPLPLSGHNRGQSIPPKPWSFSTSRVVTIRRALRSKGFSENVISITLLWLKDSSTSQYQGIWKKFINYLSAHSISHDKISLPIVCDFLAFQAQIMYRKYRTLATYKCALRHPLLFACDLEINNPISELFMRGAFRFNPPVKAKEMHSWSLNSVLRFLRTPAFEPLEDISFKRLTQKTLFLILLASGRRISEVTHLSRKCRRIPSSSRLSLLWLDDFTPKVHNPTFQTPCPSIEEISVNNGQDVILCPVRTFKSYRERTTTMLEHVPPLLRPKSLWVHPRFRLNRKIDIKYLSNIFIELIKDTRIFNDLNPEIPIGPHQTKKL